MLDCLTKDALSLLAIQAIVRIDIDDTERLKALKKFVDDAVYAEDDEDKVIH
jgi:hypothetical protein